jgi:hypothetical protein
LYLVRLLSQAPKTVQTWISRGDPTENKIPRYGRDCALVIDTAGFIHDLMRAPVGFLDDIIAEAIAVSDTPPNALPELT